jgi:hypothetical protein
MRTIVICSSAVFYAHVIDIKNELKSRGMNVVVPKSALAMEASGDFTVRKAWFNDPDAYSKKADFMRSHFDRITEGDAVLVVNDEKHEVAGYIGPNVLIEMSLAWYQRKPIYILNEPPNNTPFEEEIRGMSPIVLYGDLSQIGNQ